MKNIKFAVAVAGLLLSGLASATPFSASGNLPVTVCSNLNEDVTINLTTGVVAGVDCTSTRVAFAACHSAGMLKSRSVGRKVIQVPDTTEGAAEDATVDSTVSCSVGDVDKDCKSVAVTGAAVPSSTTNNGTVNNQYPGTGACSTTVAEGVAAKLP